VTLSHVVDAAFDAGLDLAATTAVGRYNQAVDHPYRLPGRDDRTVLVLGNTAAIWPHIGLWAEAGNDRDPVDTYVESAVAAASTLGPAVIDIRYSHEPPPRRIAIQRLAHIAGLAWLSPSHLCVHPVFGPWIALRAAIVLDTAHSDPARPMSPPCACEDHCLPYLEAAVTPGVPENRAELEAGWQRRLAVRDACPVGREHRYSDEQIRYHYAGIRPSSWPPSDPLR